MLRISRHRQFVHDDTKYHEDDNFQYGSDQSPYDEANKIGRTRHRRGRKPTDDAFLAIACDTYGERLESRTHHPDGDHSRDEQQPVVDIRARYLSPEDCCKYQHHQHRERHVEQQSLPVAEENPQLR